MTTETKTHQQLCQRIRFHLTGDDGRAVKPCGTCGGSGELPTDCPACEHGRNLEVCPVLKNHHYKGPCPDCNGSGLIENRERIAAAVKEFRFEGKPFIGKCWSDSHAKEVALTQWDIRSNMRWQSALEAHVLGEVCIHCGGAGVDNKFANHKELDPCTKCNGTGRIGGYVEPAPDYNTPEGMVLLKAMLRDANWSYEITWNSVMKSCSAVVDTGDLREAAYDFGPEHEALFRAVCLAVEA